MGDEAFRRPGDATTFSAIGDALARIEPGAALIALLSLAVLVVWDTPRFKALKRVPAPLVVVALGVSLNALFGAAMPGWRLDASHLVGLPIAETLSDWGNFFALPDLSAVTRPETWRVAVTLAVVASLETLLSSDATDKMDPYKREADTNRELMAQGVGNTCRADRRPADHRRDRALGGQHRCGRAHQALGDPARRAAGAVHPDHPGAAEPDPAGGAGGDPAVHGLQAGAPGAVAHRVGPGPGAVRAVRGDRGGHRADRPADGHRGGHGDRAVLDPVPVAARAGAASG
jgi:hypothetical protein